MEKIKLIYGDANILVVDKPSGLLSIADGYDPNLPHLRTILQPDFGPLWMVHRLDKESSGVMVLARNAEAHKDLNQQFMARNVKKLYHCLVSPVPTWQTRTCLEPLSTNTGRKHLTRVDLKHGKPAQSYFKLLQKSNDIALLECEILNGYRHQIRAHLYALGLGILGDSLYRPSQNTVPPQRVPRMALHAHQIAFIHPGNKKAVTYKAETPSLFYDLLKNPIPKDWDTVA